MLIFSRDQLLRDDRAGPVEAVDQRCADGLYERLEGNGLAIGDAGNGFWQGDAAEIRCAILGLHEQARRRDAENVQVVLDAAANKPTAAIEGR
jgi:hypothetical protein